MRNYASTTLRSGEPRGHIREVARNLPSWITPQMVHHTLRVWQRFYAGRLTPEDAVTILLSAGRLMAVLSRE